MADQMLPPEYQMEISSAQRRRALAEMLLKQSLQGSQPQMAGRIMPKTSSLAPIAQALTAFISNKSAEDADAAMGETRQRYSADETAALQKLQGLPEDDAISQGQTSQFSRAQAMAKALQERRAKQLEMQVKAISEGGDTQSAARLAAGNAPSKDYVYPGVKPIEHGVDAQGNPYSLTFNRRAEPQMSRPSPGIKIINTPEQQESAEAKALGGQMPEIARTTAKTQQGAVDAMAKADRILQLAKDPKVITGFGADPARFVESLTTKLGFTGPEGLAKTQVLLSTIAEQTLDASGELKGAITEKEWPRLAQARAGEISYTPAALQELAYIARAKAHNDFIRAYQQRGGQAEAGGTRSLKVFPAPSMGSNAFPAELYRENADGTVQYKGSVDALLPKKGPTGKPMSADEEAAALRKWLAADPATRGPLPARSN
jgi:hypothetical protein